MRRHRLFVLGSVYAAKIGTKVQGPSDDVDPQLYDRFDLGATPTLQYTFTGERIVVTSATGGTLLRFAPGHYYPRRVFESVRLSTPLSEHTDLLIRGEAIYSPFYSFDLSVDPEQEDTIDVVPDDALQVVALRKNLNVDAGARLALPADAAIDVVD